MRGPVVDELTGEINNAIGQYSAKLTSPLTAIEIGQACLAIMFTLGYNIRVRQELQEREQNRGLMRGSEIGA